MIRPAVRRRLTAPKVQLGIEALEGKKAVVLGRVAQDGGQQLTQVWTARPLNDGDVFEPATGDVTTRAKYGVVFKDV